MDSKLYLFREQSCTDSEAGTATEICRCESGEAMTIAHSKCGRHFTADSASRRYCSSRCQSDAKIARARQERQRPTKGTRKVQAVRSSHKGGGSAWRAWRTDTKSGRGPKAHTPTQAQQITINPSRAALRAKDQPRRDSFWTSAPPEGFTARCAGHVFPDPGVLLKSWTLDYQ